MNLVDFITESLKVHNINEGEISSEKEFREYAHAKLKEVFGDFRPYSSVSRKCKSFSIGGKHYIIHRWKIKDLED